MYYICSCLSGDDGSTSMPITGNNVDIMASQDSSINSKARGSNKVRQHTLGKREDIYIEQTALTTQQLKAVNNFMNLCPKLVTYMFGQPSCI